MIDVRAALGLTRSRRLELEGIPMYLTLPDAPPAPEGDPRREEGPHLAAALHAVHAELVVAHAEVPHEDADEVDPEELLLAEALTVLAFGWFDGIGPDAPGGQVPERRPVGTPLPPGRLGLVLRALEEGRYLRVVNYHNTPVDQREQVRAELVSLATRFAAIDLAGLERLVATGRLEPGARPPVLPVFYEGYRNNFEVAGPACDEAGLTGWFFVITGFVDTPVRQQHAFAEAHWIGLADGDRAGDRLAMTWDEAAELAGRHVVTSHTATHAGIFDVRTPEDFEREVVAPSEAVGRATGVPSVAHAWLHGLGTGWSPEHDTALRNAGYEWCFANTAIHRLVPAMAGTGVLRESDRT